MSLPAPRWLLHTYVCQSCIFAQGYPQDLHLTPQLSQALRNTHRTQHMYVLKQTGYCNAGGWLVTASKSQSQNAGEVSQTVL